MRHGLTNREQAHFKAVHKEGQSEYDKKGTRQQAEHIIRWLLQHKYLEKSDDKYNRRKITQATQHGAKKFQNI
jgi:hypothetical protein